jgi:hypothetical protein
MDGVEGIACGAGLRRSVIEGSSVGWGGEMTFRTRCRMRSRKYCPSIRALSAGYFQAREFRM